MKYQINQLSTQEIKLNFITSVRFIFAQLAHLIIYTIIYMQKLIIQNFRIFSDMLDRICLEIIFHTVLSDEIK